MMHIVFNIDDQYARHCAVTMASVIANNRGEAIRFHILSLKVSRENKQKLSRMAEKAGMETCFYDIDESLVVNLPNLNSGHYLTAATYMRLYITEFLPNDVNKILYLDCDLVVRHNLTELWDTDMDGFAIAAAEDQGDDFTPWFDACLTDGYFNAGVFVANLDYWRKNNVVAEFNAFLEKNWDKIIMHDQDVLNGVFHDRKITIDQKWNIFNRMVDGVRCVTHPQYYASYGKDPYIIHYSGPEKPWNSIRYHLFFKDYHKYRRRTPWKRMKITYRQARRWGKPIHILHSRLGFDKYFIKNQIRKYKKSLSNEK